VRAAGKSATRSSTGYVIPERSTSDAMRPKPLVRTGLHKGNMSGAWPVSIRNGSVFPSVSPTVGQVVFGDFQRSPVIPFEPWCPGDLDTIVTHGLSGVALRMQSEGKLDIPELIEATLRSAAFHDSASTVEIARATLPAVANLRRHGIEFAVTKGPGVAAVGRGVTERPFCDIDILVEPEQFTEARELLDSWNYKEDLRSRQPWLFFDRYCREAVNLRSEDGGSIDLHHHLPPWYWGTQVDIGDVIATATMASLYEHDTPIASPVHNFMVVALHLMSDRNRPGQRLMIWRDLLVIAAVCDPEEIADFAGRCGLEGWVQWIISQYPSMWRPRQIERYLPAHRVRIHGRRRLERILERSAASESAVGQVNRLPVPNAVLFVAGMTVPSRSFLTEQMPDSPPSYRRWWWACIRRITSAKSARRRPNGTRWILKRSNASGCTGRDAHMNLEHNLKRTETKCAHGE